MAKSKKESKKKSIYESWKLLANIFIGVAISTSFFFLSIEKVKNNFSIDFMLGILTLFLLLTTILWLIMYIYVLVTELELFNETFDFVGAPRPMANDFIRLLLIAIYFGLLISTTSNLLYYSVLIILLQFFDILQAWYLQKNMFKTIILPKFRTVS